MHPYTIQASGNCASIEKNPLNKIGSADDISNLVAFLLSDKSNKIFG